MLSLYTKNILVKVYQDKYFLRKIYLDYTNVNENEGNRIYDVTRKFKWFLKELYLEHKVTSTLTFPYINLQKRIFYIPTPLTNKELLLAYFHFHINIVNNPTYEESIIFVNRIATAYSIDENEVQLLLTIINNAFNSS
jgi:hypothetical protein